MQRKRLRGLSLICLTFLLLISTSFIGLAKGNEKVTITFWNGFTASDGDVLRDIVNKFNALHKGEIEVDMDIMPWDVMFQKLPPAIATNTAPNFVLMGHGFMGEYVGENAIQPLDDIWSHTNLDEGDFVPEVLDMLKMDGHQYAIPMQYNQVYLFWNKDMFAEVGLDPDVAPTTWEETIEFARKLTDPKKNQFGMGLATNSAPLYWLSLMWGEGGEILDIETKQSLINDEKIAAPLALIQDAAVNLKVSPSNATGPELDNMFWAERLAMSINGPWLINGLKEAGINFGVAAAPGGSKRHQVPMESIGFYVPTTTAEKEKMAVYKFIEYWNSTEIAKEWTMRNGFPPYLYSVINDPEVQNDPIQSIIAPLGDLGKVWDQGYPYASMVIDDVFWPLIEQVLTGNASPEEALEQADKTLTRILETYH